MAGYLPAEPTQALLRVYRLLGRIHAEPQLAGKLQGVVDAVVEAVGFELAALNVLLPSGDYEVMAVAGSEEARRALLGVVVPAGTFEAEFAAAEKWGGLLFIPHERASAPYPGSWTPDRPALRRSDAWHPEDALLAPLPSPTGALVGVLSVDLPRNGLLPSREQCRLLEVLTSEVAVAVHNGMLSQQLRIDEELFRQAFEASGSGMALSGVSGDRPGPLTRVNPALSALLQQRPEALLQLTEDELTHDDDRPGDDVGLQDLMAGRIRTFRRDKRMHRGDGSSVWVTVTSTITRDSSGRARTVVSQIDDISAARSEWEQLHHRATHDVLTGLPHREAVLSRLGSSIDVARRSGRPGAVLFLDLNDFKLVNDRFGHAVGDALLQAVAARLVAAVRSDDLVGRWGGDEFVVVADELSVDGAGDLAERLRASISRPFAVGGVSTAVTVSIGSCEIGPDEGDPAALLDRADLDMYRRKLVGRRKGVDNDRPGKGLARSGDSPGRAV